MKRRSPILVCLAVGLVSALVMTGCATKRYGRAQPLSSFEESEYSCRELQLEIHKVEAFEDHIRQEAKIDGRSVLGFLGDFGIGNAMERADAEESARVRKEQLRALQHAKQCTATLPAGSPAES